MKIVSFFLILILSFLINSKSNSQILFSVSDSTNHFFIGQEIKLQCGFKYDINVYDTSGISVFNTSIDSCIKKESIVLFFCKDKRNEEKNYHNSLIFYIPELNSGIYWFKITASYLKKMMIIK